jgi:hypothetical protein
MSDLLNSASLVMIPSGYKEDVVYSQIPTDGSGDLSFTRASNGTRVNSAGLVEVVSWNLLEYSEDFSNGVWVKTNTTVTTNTTTAPNGTTTADKFAPNGTLTASYFSISQAITSGATSQAHTAIVYAKAGGLGQMLFYLGSQIGIYFNLTNGQFISYYNGVQTITNYSSEAVGDGWYKYTISVSGSSGIIYHEVYGAKSGAFIGNYTTADDCFVWGAQLNIGATAKPYFPTTDRLNVPRLTYQNGGGGCPSLLLEKQSTNLVLQSEDFTFTSGIWLNATGGGTASVSVTANYGISPDGTQNADRIQLNKGNTGYSEIYQLFSTTIGSTYTQTLWLKSLSGTPKINFGYTGSTRGTITLTTEWKRYEFTYVSGGNPNGVALTLFDGFDPSTAQSIDVLAWGAQAELSSYPTSYIPTTSSSATRVADVCGKTGISSLIGQTQGTIFWDGVATQGDYNQLMFIKDSSSIQFIGLTIASGVIYGEIYNSGYIQLFSYAIGSGETRFKIALTYKTNDFAMYVNGVQVATASTGTTPTSFDDLYLNNINDTRDFNCEVKQAIIFSTRLTNAELASLTTI